MSHIRRVLPADRPAAEDGAALVIALVFLIIGTFTVLALTNLTSVHLIDTFQLQGERAVEYAADGGADGAIQSLRYSQPNPGGACPSYVPSTALNEDGASYFTYATCASMTPATGTSSGVVNPQTITAPGSPSCIPEDVGQQVYDNNSQGNIAPGTLVTGCQGTSWLISNPAKNTSATVTIGSSGQRLFAFYACSAQFSLGGCTPGQAFVTAVVLFYNSDTTGSVVPGFQAVVQSWTVTKANG